MKYRGGREESRSILESSSSEFTGWQEEGAQVGQNILKQFKKNLNNYEKNYNELNREAYRLKRRSKSLLKDSLCQKENFMKLPALNAMFPKQQKDYSAFLESEFTRHSVKMQQSSVINYTEGKAPKVVVFIDDAATKGNNRCESFIQFYKNKGEAKPYNLFLKKHKIFSISKTLKLSKLKDRRVSTKLISYQPSKQADLQPKYSNDITLFTRQNE